jgi:hypothetical protein
MSAPMEALAALRSAAEEALAAYYVRVIRVDHDPDHSGPEDPVTCRWRRRERAGPTRPIW